MLHCAGAVSRTLEMALAEWECSAICMDADEKSCICKAEQRGIHDVIFHATARTNVPGCALELIVPVLMLLRPENGDGEALGLGCNDDDVRDKESGI